MSYAALHDMISLSLHGKERVKRKEQRLFKKQKAHDPWDSIWQNPASHGLDMTNNQGVVNTNAFPC